MVPLNKCREDKTLAVLIYCDVVVNKSGVLDMLIEEWDSVGQEWAVAPLLPAGWLQPLNESWMWANPNAADCPGGGGRVSQLGFGLGLAVSLANTPD